MTAPDQPISDSDVPEQFRIRQAKRERLLAEGREPYPVEVARTHTLAEIRKSYPDLPANSETGQVVGVAGRVMFARNSGKLCFATLQEGDGTQLRENLLRLCIGDRGDVPHRVHLRVRGDAQLAVDAYPVAALELEAQ